jgi:DNA-binding CsgD family transcriptional regulator
VGTRRNALDAIRAPNFSRQVLTGLVGSTIGFAICDRWFRYLFVNEALARMNRVPPQDHIGETIHSITGDAAVKIEPAIHAVFDKGKVVSAVEIIASLPKRPDAGHWTETYVPIRDARGRIKQVGIFVVEVDSHAQSEETAIGVNQQLLERAALNTDRTQELLLELRRLRGKYGPLRADSERIIDEITAAASERRSRPMHGSASLSKREGQIVTLLAKGRSNKEIANTLNISVKTVESYRARVFLKLDLDSIASLVRYAIRNKMVEP